MLYTNLFKKKKSAHFYFAPARAILFSFISVIVIGSFLLSLPFASKSGVSIGIIDALFTATSATCVTGLVVVDTYNHWTVFGQLVILFLIQIGGLGFITIATFFSVILGKKMGIKEMTLAQEAVNYFTFTGAIALIKRIIIMTLLFEFLGAILLSFSFVPSFGIKGLYLSIFHSISAFCNAGFDLMGILGKGDFVSLTSFNNDPFVIYTIPILIIIGGLGFIVLEDLLNFKKTKTLQLHTKLVLSVTLFLIVFGSILFFVFEHNNPATMGNLNLIEKINSSFFQSVTTRTAGYNSLPIDPMREISKVTTIILMFIGAAPGSTAGGIKVTTLGVVMIAIISQIRGNNVIVIFKRKVSSVIVNKSLAIIGLSGILVVTITTIMLARESTLSFINVLYEVTSAFGTVGLSTGITPHLLKFSKLLLIMTMFLGRVGPLSFAVALALKSNSKNSNIIYPEGKIVVG